MKSTFGAALVLSLAVISVCWSADAGNAAPQGQVTVQPSPSSAVPQNQQERPRTHNKNGTSTNWSGYAVETNLGSPQSNVVTDVKGTWVVPTVSGTGTSYCAVWVGIDGYGSPSVEQIGTDSDLSSPRPGLLLRLVRDVPGQPRQPLQHSISGKTG